jgi:hypothetical protein
MFCGYWSLIYILSYFSHLWFSNPIFSIVLHLYGGFTIYVIFFKNITPTNSRGYNCHCCLTTVYLDSYIHVVIKSVLFKICLTYSKGDVKRHQACTIGPVPSTVTTSKVQ